MSVRITAAGAVAFAFLAYLTAPVSACDERFIKKCEKAAAAAAAAAPEEPAASAAKRKSASRVHVVVSRRGKLRLAKRMRAPQFAARGSMVLASAESRMTLAPDSPMARRFRGFIDPQPMAQNAFETLRKPHLVALNLEPPASLPEAAPAVAEAAPEPAAPAMELASAESKPVVLRDPAPAKPAPVAPASAASAAPIAQASMTAAPPPAPEQPSRFPVHQLVIALCGALGAASALRFIVGA
jgi:hypothetical protein